MTRRTALIVAVPEAEDAVGALRLEHDWSAARGVPAHVTVLFPFLDAGAVDEEAVAEVIASHRAFDFRLASVEFFPEALTYLAPVPDAPFRELTAAIWRRWPSHPPYEGAFEDVVPHLTVAEKILQFEPALPIACRARDVVLIEETADGRWTERRRFSLGN